MKVWMKLLLGFALSFMCIFTSIGYAEQSALMKIEGEAEVDPPTAIYIVDVTNVQTSGATVVTAPVNIGFPSTKVLSEITFDKNGSYVTFDVLIKNGTTFDQYFDVLEEYPAIEGLPDTFNYANVKWTVTPPQGTKISPNQSVWFTVKLTYTGSNTNQTRKMLHEFDFVLDSNDLTQAVSEGVTNKFEDILNNRLEEDVSYMLNGEKITISKDKTYDAVVDNMENDWFTGDYIGNLEGANADDKALLTALFEGALTFQVGNEEVPITVMVKQKNVVGSNEDEMVLYITADDLSAASTYVPVYAVVFTKDASGVWTQIGDIFAGEARTNDYSGSSGSGSFNTERWRSTEVYYGVAVRSGISTIMRAYKA